MRAVSRTKDLTVLVVSPLGYTGLAYYDYSLCQALSKHGTDVELCTSDSWILTQYKNCFKIAPMYKRCSGDISKVVKGVNYLLASVRILLHALKNNKQVVHFQIVEIPLLDLSIMLILKAFGRSIVYTPHDIIRGKKNPFKKLVTSWLYSTADRLIVHKDFNRKTLIEHFEVDQKKIKIIPHGSYEFFVDGKITKSTARKILGLSEVSKIVLFFGNITPGKGLDVLIKAMPIVRQDVENLVLLIAGRVCGGLTKDWVRSALESQRISEHVISKLEFIPVDKIIFYYMASDIIILPYTEISESGVLRFAQTCGKPVLCSDLKEFRDTVLPGQTGYFFKTGDPADLARQLVIAFSDENLEKVGESAREMMKDQYSWNRIGLLTKDVYEQVM